MITDDIRTQFQTWLKGKGCQEKTSKGRPSTIYEYVKRIDRLCDKLYSSHTSDEWEKLAQNIDSVLVSYYESCNQEYYINKYNLKDALQYFNDIGKMCSNSDYPQANLHFVYNKDYDLISSIKICQIEDYLRIFDFVLDSEDKYHSAKIDDFLTLYVLSYGGTEQVKNFLAISSQSQCTSFSDVSICIQYNDKDNAKTKAALIQYYDFLQISSDSFIVAKLKDKRNDNEIKLYIAKVEEALDNLMKCLPVLEVTGKNALQIRAVYPNGYLSKTEIINTLGIDHKTLDKLNKVGLLTPNKTKGFYDEKVVNEYLKNHFHKTKEVYSDVDYSSEGGKWWCNRKEAAKIRQCTERSIYNYTKKGLLTYTDYAPQAPKYYKPELEYLAHHR